MDIPPLFCAQKAGDDNVEIMIRFQMTFEKYTQESSIFENLL